MQTLTTPCVSVACWFYDTHPLARDLMPSSGAASHLASLLPTKPSRPTPTVRNSFGGLFFGLSPDGAELSLLRWLEQVIAMQLNDSAAFDNADAAARKAQQGGEAYGGAAKLRAVAACMRCVGQLADGRSLSREESARLPPLKVALEALLSQINDQLCSDLVLSSKSQAATWVRTVVERVGFVPKCVATARQ